MVFSIIDLSARFSFMCNNTKFTVSDSHHIQILAFKDSFDNTETHDESFKALKILLSLRTTIS